jgi:formyl-CoA transferase
MSLCPYNVYPTSDGYLAIITNNDQHWNWLVEALGCKELAADPRLQTVKGRCENMDEVDAAIGAVTIRFTKTELFDLLIKNRVPCAPVRTVPEVINDPHLHARGSLQWIDHPEYGRIVVPSSPLRFAGEEKMPYRPSAALGQDTQAILSERLGMTPAQIEQLREERAL